MLLNRQLDLRVFHVLLKVSHQVCAWASTKQFQGVCPRGSQHVDGPPPGHVRVSLGNVHGAGVNQGEHGVWGSTVFWMSSTSLVCQRASHAECGA